MIAGHAIDWYWMISACPASAYDAERPYDGQGVFAGWIVGFISDEGGVELIGDRGKVIEVRSTSHHAILRGI